MDFTQNLKNILTNILNSNQIVNPSVIFDIDGTLIDLEGRPIMWVIDFYKYCLSIGMTVFIVTARLGSEQNISYTKDQLTSFGINNYKSSYFMRPDASSVEMFKYSARKHINQRGFNTVMALGDNDWDIGDYGGYGILIKS